MRNLFALIYPKKEEVIPLSAEKSKTLTTEQVNVERPQNPTLSDKIDHSYTINMIFGAMGLSYIIWHFATKGFDLNLNIVIFIFFILGVILHGKPINSGPFPFWGWPVSPQGTLWATRP